MKMFERKDIDKEMNDIKAQIRLETKKLELAKLHDKVDLLRSKRCARDIKRYATPFSAVLGRK